MSTCTWVRSGCCQSAACKVSKQRQLKWSTHGNLLLVYATANYGRMLRNSKVYNTRISFPMYTVFEQSPCTLKQLQHEIAHLHLCWHCTPVVCTQLWHRWYPNHDQCYHTPFPILHWHRSLPCLHSQLVHQPNEVFRQCTPEQLWGGNLIHKELFLFKDVHSNERLPYIWQDYLAGKIFTIWWYSIAMKICQVFSRFLTMQYNLMNNTLESCSSSKSLDKSTVAEASKCDSTVNLTWDWGHRH